MLDERLEARDERKNVIASVAKHSVIVLFVVIFFSACTDYVSQIEDRYGEWEASNNVHSSSSVKVVDPTKISLGSMTDARDGQKYKTVKIGTQTWMAQNLNYETANSYCYNDTASNCAKYGRLYTWAAAKSACPTGWHLPSHTEWNTLFAAVGGQSIAGSKFKSASGWYDNGNGTNDFSFSALPAGFRKDYGGYGYEGYRANFWSSTEDNSYQAYRMDLSYASDNAYLNNYYKGYGFSVRCLKD